MESNTNKLCIQLKKWQMHMQEQLKAHQLEELLRLQGEQQKLLEMNGPQHCEGGEEERRDLSDIRVACALFVYLNFPLARFLCLTDYTEGSGLSGAEWEESRVHGDTPTINCPGVPQGSTRSPQQEKEFTQTGRPGRLQRPQDMEMDEEAGGETAGFCT